MIYSFGFFIRSRYAAAENGIIAYSFFFLFFLILCKVPPCFETAVAGGVPSRKSPLIQRTWTLQPTAVYWCLLIQQTVVNKFILCKVNLTFNTLVKAWSKGHPQVSAADTHTYTVNIYVYIGMSTDVYVDTDTQDNSSVFWTPALSLAATCLDLYGTTLAEHSSDFQRVIIHQHFWYFIPFEHAFSPHLSYTVTVSLLLIET